jgi:hypothetical protein
MTTKMDIKSTLLRITPHNAYKILTLGMFLPYHVNYTKGFISGQTLEMNNEH